MSQLLPDYELGLHKSSCHCPMEEGDFYNGLQWSKFYKQGCPVAQCNIVLYGKEEYILWRKIGNQLMSKAIPYSISPYVLGHDSNGKVIAIRGPNRKESNGEWIVNQPTQAIPKLEIKTVCRRWKWPGTADELIFTFCQNGQCCSTDPLGLPKGNANCKHPDVYLGEELGDCAKFDFSFETIHGNVTFADKTALVHDGWNGQWFKLIFEDEGTIKCNKLPLIGFSDRPDVKDYFEFNCSP